MYKKAIHVGDLQFGMYIAELDRPWTDTPFMFQGFYLQTERQLEALRKYCRQVFVDAARSDPSALARARQAAVSPPPATPGFQVRGTATYPGGTALEREIHVAGELYEQATKTLRGLFAQLAAGNTALDGKEIDASVRKLADCVIRNPDALLLMSKMRDTTGAAYARALQVCVYMMVFARFLQLERDQIHLLGLLGLLQDIGKARLPGIVLEHKFALTPEGEEVYRKHVELSAHILAVTSGLPPKLPAFALLHHERQDGRGYPRGLKGYQIGLNGSIAAICDRYDQLLAPAPYGEGRAPSAAVNVLLGERGSAFHGPLLEQFIRCLGSFPVGTVVELNSGECAVVVAENAMQRLKPKVVLAHRRQLVDLATDTTPSGEPYRIRRALEQQILQFDPRNLLPN